VVPFGLVREGDPKTPPPFPQAWTPIRNPSVNRLPPDLLASGARRARWGLASLLLSLLTLSVGVPSAAAQLATVGSAGENVTLGGWIQPAWEYRSLDGVDDRQGFFLRRARLDVTGALLDGTVRFRLLPDLSRSPELRDAWVEVRGGSGFALRMGQQTVPFDLQRERHMGRSHFGERALAARRFELAGGRDVGVVGAWRSGAGRMALQAGAFNGLGPNRQEAGTDPLLALRGVLTFGGAASSGETDLARTPEPAATFGFGVMSAESSLLRPRPGFAAEVAAEWTGWTTDLHFRLQGLSLAASWFSQSITPEGAPSTGRIEGEGWFASAGWVLPRHPVELAVRRSQARWDRDRDEGAEVETTLGATYFHDDHQLQTRFQLQWERQPLLPGSGRAMRVTIEHQLLLGG